MLPSHMDTLGDTEAGATGFSTGGKCETSLHPPTLCKTITLERFPSCNYFLGAGGEVDSPRCIAIKALCSFQCKAAETVACFLPFMNPDKQYLCLHSNGVRTYLPDIRNI